VWAYTGLLCLQQMVHILTVVLQRVNYHVPELSFLSFNFDVHASGALMPAFDSCVHRHDV